MKVKTLQNCMLKLRKIFLSLLIVLVCFGNLIAQNSYHGDDKWLHFGFSLGINTLDFGITPSSLDINGNVYQADVSELKPGFSVGIVSDLLITRHWNLRFTPTMHIGDRELSYTNNLANPDVISSVLISTPVYLKYSSERYGNLRPYLIGGGGAYVDLGRDNNLAVLLKPFDPFVEVGVGCDIYFSFFKLAPELKFALGFNNMLTPLDERDTGSMQESDKVYTQALSKLTSRLITLTFNFE
jgi:hypothetical protein